MLAPRPPPPTRALVPLALAGLLAATGCFTDRGAGLTPYTADASTGTVGSTGADTSTSTGSTGADATTGLASSTGAALPTTGDGTGGDSSTGECDGFWYIDIDGDSYGGPETLDGCGPPPRGFTLDSLDCDDTKPAIHPGAAELCDDLDNDCDLGVDEWPAGQLEACNGCQADLYAGHHYYYCATPEVTRKDARERCQLLLGDLVIVDEPIEHEHISDTVKELGGKWWIGLSDQDIEGTFVWVDGSPLDPTLKPWANNEPDDLDHVPMDADCVIISTSFLQTSWRDQSCANTRPFVCEDAGD